MKRKALALAAVAAVSTGVSSAASLMLNFRSTSTNAAAGGDVAGGYRTLSPAHSLGVVTGTDVAWNNFSTTASSNSLVYADGTPATGITITFGTEATTGSGSVDFGTVGTINTAALFGSGGGVANQQPYTGHQDSIYGDGNVSGNSAPARAGWLGGGNSSAGNAIGFRIDGLEAGEYTLYFMGRNSNAVTAAPMNLYTTTGASASSFAFSALTADVQSNVTYPSTNPTAYNTFIDGENYVAVNFTVGTGDSFFLAVDGGSTAETRGFINMAQIVAVPEPSVAMLGFLTMALLALRHRRA
jgi:hypothetical protein